LHELSTVENDVPIRLLDAARKPSFSDLQFGDKGWKESG
jgi:hypothetical protein